MSANVLVLLLCIIFSYYWNNSVASASVGSLPHSTGEGEDAALANSSEDGKSSEAKVGGGESSPIYATESDFLFLYMNASSLPGVEGYGVFAKYDIPPDEIICEYRGSAIENTIYVKDVKIFATKVNGQVYRVIGDTICSYINDCAHVYGSNYTFEEIAAMYSAEAGEDSIPTFEGYEYNAVSEHTKMGKVLIKSVRPIKAGEEICFSYGRYMLHVRSFIVCTEHFFCIDLQIVI